MTAVLEPEVTTRLRDTHTAPQDVGDRVRQTVWQQYSDNRTRPALDTLAISRPDEDDLLNLYAVVKAWQSQTHPTSHLTEIRNRWVHSQPDEPFSFSADVNEIRETIEELREKLDAAWAHSPVAVRTRATNETSTPVSYFRAARHGTGPRQAPGVLAINHRREVIFTEEVELQLDALPRRKSRIVLDRRMLEDDE